MILLKEYYANTKTICRHVSLQVGNMYGIKTNKIRNNKCRDKDTVEARQIIAFFLCVYEDLNMDAIASFLGCSDHSWVRYAINNISDKIEAYDEWNEKMNKVRNQIYNLDRKEVLA